MELFASVSGLLMLIVEKLCEFVFQILALVGVKEIKPEAKAIAVTLFSVVMSFLLQLDVFPLLGMAFVFPWLGPLFTGLLVGAGADLYHIGKERILKPTVSA
jgi:hypothetical protein